MYQNQYRTSHPAPSQQQLLASMTHSSFDSINCLKTGGTDPCMPQCLLHTMCMQHNFHALCNRLHSMPLPTGTLATKGVNLGFSIQAVQCTVRGEHLDQNHGASKAEHLNSQARVHLQCFSREQDYIPVMATYDIRSTTPCGCAAAAIGRC